MQIIKFDSYGEDGKTIFSGEIEIDHEPQNDDEINSMLCDMFDNHIPADLHDAIAGVNIT